MAESQPIASGTSYVYYLLTIFANPLVDRRNSPLLSNNPFRNRIPSEPQSPGLPIQGGRPVSTNPFLDSTEIRTAQTTVAPVATAPNGRMSPDKKTFTENTTELFVRSCSYSMLVVTGAVARSQDNVLFTVRYLANLVSCRRISALSRNRHGGRFRLPR